MEPGAASVGRHPLRALDPGRRTAEEVFLRRVREFPDRTLVALPDEIPYGVAERRVAGVVAWLEELGVTEGDRVSVVSENRVELLELLLACGFLGALYVPVNPFLRGEQLAHQLRDADAAIVVVEHGQVDKVAAALADAADGPRLIGLGESLWEVDVPPPASSGRPLEARSRPGDPLAVLYTSGTTGPAKGVVCPTGQFFWWAVLQGEYLELGPGDRLYTTLPMYHVNALTAYLQAVGAGGTYSFARRFSASRFFDQAREIGATVTYLLGAMITILHKQPASDGDRDHRLRIALSPAVPPDLRGAFRERFGIELIDGFGMTELNLVISARASDQQPGRMGTVVEDFEARVVDERDFPVADGEPGELVARPRQPHSIASGYWRNPDATVEAWRNLWMHTGDRVVRHPDGSIQYLDRLKDAIRRRGENISTFEVEAVVGAHPDVAEAACVGVEAELGEEEVMVYVLLQPGAEVVIPDLLRWCAERLVYFAVPRFVEVLDDLPRTPNGKVRKAALRERGVGETTFDREREGVEIPRGG